MAEDADAYQAISPSVERDIRREIVLIHHPGGGEWSDLAARIRFPASMVESKISVTRAWFRKRRVDRFRWMIGRSSRPADIDGLAAARPTLQAPRWPTSTRPYRSSAMRKAEPPSARWSLPRSCSATSVRAG